MPVPGSNTLRRSRPESTTARTPSIVRLVSAMLVARTTLRLPARAGSSAASCSAAGSSPYSGNTSTSAPRSAFAESRLHSPDLARARQKHEQIAGGFRERAPHDARDDRLRRLVAVTAWTRQRGQAFADVVRLDRMHAPRVLDHRCAAEQPRDGGAVEGRRHREHAQRRRDVSLRIERERETDVGVQAPLVELVEDHGRDAAERGIALQHPREYAFGDDLEPRLGADARLEPHPIADGGAGPLAERRRHPRGDRSRGETARLEQHDLLAARPRLVEQRERHDGALARARRRDEHRVAAVGQRGAQPRQGFVDRQAGAHEARILPRAPRAGASDSSSAACPS